jgi:hypothetical protein
MKTETKTFGVTKFLVVDKSVWKNLKYKQKLACGKTLFSEEKQEFPDDTNAHDTAGEAFSEIMHTPKIIITETQVAPDTWRYFVFYGNVDKL